MSNEQYFARDNADAFESERLGYLQQMCNPLTFRRLEALGVAPGWRCLDVGAGEGTVARWLAARVGATGRVVAADLDTRLLRTLTDSNIEVRTHDVLAADFEPGHYDLVHCRALLAHLPEPEQALRRMVAALRPGGWLCIEEGDYGAWDAVPVGTARGQRFARSFRTLFDMLYTKKVLNPYYGRLTRQLLEGLGLEDVGQDGVQQVSYGNEASASFHLMAIAVLRQPTIAAGVLTADDYDALERDFRDPAFAFLGVTLFGAWGRRPG